MDYCSPKRKAISIGIIESHVFTVPGNHLYLCGGGPFKFGHATEIRFEVVNKNVDEHGITGNERVNLLKATVYACGRLESKIRGRVLVKLPTEDPSVEVLALLGDHSSGKISQVGKGGLLGTWRWFRIKRVKVPPGKGVVNQPVFTSKSVTPAMK